MPWWSFLYSCLRHILLVGWGWVPSALTGKPRLQGTEYQDTKVRAKQRNVSTHNTVAGNVRSYPTYARQGRIHNYCWYCYSLRKWLNPAHTFNSSNYQTFNKMLWLVYCQLFGVTWKWHCMLLWHWWQACCLWSHLSPGHNHWHCWGGI